MLREFSIILSIQLKIDELNSVIKVINTMTPARELFDSRRGVQHVKLALRLVYLMQFALEKIRRTWRSPS